MATIDIASAQAALERIKPMSLHAALVVLRKGTDAITEAISVARGASGWLSGELPGGGARQRVSAALDLHARLLGRLMAGGADPTTPYPEAEALRRDVLRAFIELNAVEARNDNPNTAWRALGETFDELAEEAKAIVKSIGEGLDEVKKAGDKWLKVTAIAAGVVVVVGGAVLLSRR